MNKLSEALRGIGAAGQRQWAKASLERAERRIWGQAETLEDLCELTAQWCEGKLGSTPSHGAPPMPETIPIAKVLAHVNRAGFLTIGSQPGCVIPATPTWPEVVQRAVVDGFASDEMLARLREVIVGTRLEIVVGETYRWGRRVRYDKAFPATTVGGHPATDFGGTLSRRYVAFIWDGILVDKITAMHQVTIHDPEWGEHDLLWERLSAL